MVAGGLKKDSDGLYVDAMANMALDMQAFVVRYIAPNGEPLKLRIGMATGPIVAGVIGKRKFSYDLWGDTVNIASRVASEAQAGCIQADAVTYRRLHNRYRFEDMHQIQVKGKGVMQVYTLRGGIAAGEGAA